MGHILILPEQRQPFTWGSWTVYNLPGSGLSGAVSGTQFGTSVSIAEDVPTVVAVGDREHDEGPGGQSGSVHVFDWNGAGYTERQKIFGDASGDYLGVGVHMAPDASRILALASQDPTSGVGYAYNLDLSGGTYSKGTKWPATTATWSTNPPRLGEGDGNYGDVCRLDETGTTAVMMATGDNHIGAAGSFNGGGRIVSGSLAGAATEFRPSDALTDTGRFMHFGTYMGASRDLSVVAVARGYQSGSGPSPDEIAIFDCSSGTAVELAILGNWPLGLGAGEPLGNAVDVSGDGQWIVIGAQISGWQRVYLFEKTGPTSFVQRWVGTQGGSYGYCVTINYDGTRFAVGANSSGTAVYSRTGTGVGTVVTQIAAVGSLGMNVQRLDMDKFGERIVVGDLVSGAGIAKVIHATS